MKQTSNKIYSNSGNQDILGQIQGNKLTILDVGCGNGDNARLLQEKGHIVDGITFSNDEMENAKKYMRKVFVFNLEEGLPLLNSKYDFIICSHVLEHIAYPERLLSDIKLVLNEKGRLLVALPNLLHYKSRLTLLSGNFPMHESGIWDYTHLRWYTFKSGAELFERNGFVVEKKWVSGDIPLLTLFRAVPLKVRRYVFRLLITLSSGFFGGQLLYRISKKL